MATVEPHLVTVATLEPQPASPHTNRLAVKIETAIAVKEEEKVRRMVEFRTCLQLQGRRSLSRPDPPIPIDTHLGIRNGGHPFGT